MDKKELTTQEQERAKRETEEIAEAAKKLPAPARASLLGFIMGMQLATAEKAV
jgi:hypothetical protein